MEMTKINSNSHIRQLCCIPYNKPLDPTRHTEGEPTDPWSMLTWDAEGWMYAYGFSGEINSELYVEMRLDEVDDIGRFHIISHEPMAFSVILASRQDNPVPVVTASKEDAAYLRLHSYKEQQIVLDNGTPAFCLVPSMTKTSNTMLD
jgi:hypothetical protein